MKKSLLFAAVASLAFSASAQTVQDIPNAEWLKLDQGTYSIVTINMPAEDTVDPNTGDVIPGVDKPRVVENKNDGVQQFDSMNDGDVAVLKLNNTQESCYVLHFVTGTKNNGSSLLFELLDNDDNIEWSCDYTVANNGEWNARNKMLEGMAFIEDPLPTGEYKFRITFRNEAGGRTATVNLREISFEARENITSYSINLEVEPAGAGVAKKSPDMPMYLADAEVTISATANKGYKFVGWEAETEDGDTYTIEEASTKVFATSNVTYYAMFEEVIMTNKVPGTISFDTRILMNGAPESTFTTGKNVTLDGEGYNTEEDVTYLANYRAVEEGKGNNSEQFELDVTKAGNYTILAPTSTKQDEAHIIFTIYDFDEYTADAASAQPEYTGSLTAEKTGSWQKFVSNKLENVNLTEGHKLLNLEFHEPAVKKYTANLLYIKMGIGDDFGEEEAGIENVAVENNVNVKYYNLQGIEVAPSTKGLLILSNGTKVLNK